MTTEGNFEVLEPLKFLEDIEKEARTAKKRIWAQAMEVEGGEITNRLLRIIADGAKKCLDSRLHVDYYTLMVTDGLFNYLAFAFDEKAHFRQQRKKQLFASLSEAGVNVTFTNKPSLLNRIIPTRGRNHMKIVVIDNTAWIGGINFHDRNLTAHDIMVKITEEPVVSAIAETYEKVERGELAKNYSVDFGNDSTLLIDAGRSNNSIILKHACELVQQAKTTVYVTTAFIPDGVFLHALHKASQKGVDVEVVTALPEVLPGVYKWVNRMSQFTIDVKMETIPIHYLNKLVHAKILIVDGNKAIFGSHNFSAKGVSMLTSEIALMSQNKKLIHNLNAFYRHVRYQHLKPHSIQ
ncbi:MAG: phosphatidylserine/phosphatidylglycerophosphate/cardiolipin synthase family protein [Candidatus Levybacteria bacterium]|nr:phosphatidylserine/phosphatidylglycerophosphate/cardiolipin synthase family protein [Candidatus Levybacteria bacterium]